DGGPTCTDVLRTIARSNVLSAARWRTLTWRSALRASTDVGERGCATPTIARTSSSTGTTAAAAATANSSSVEVRLSAIGGTRPRVDVDGEPEHQHVDDERGHPEAHERKRDARERQHGEIAGYGDGELTEREHDPGDGDPR